jgi:hypothetical protein
MKVLIERPPMWEKIDAAFNVRGRAVIFTFGDIVYNPMGVGVSKALIRHEAKHSVRQQREGWRPEMWWERYISDPEFRLDEEIHAHIAEYAYIKATERDRNRQARYLQGCAARLAGPLYGNLLTIGRARSIILNGGSKA